MKMDTSISRLNPKLVDNRKYYQTWRGMSSFCCKGKVYVAYHIKFKYLVQVTVSDC